MARFIIWAVTLIIVLGVVSHGAEAGSGDAKSKSKTSKSKNAIVTGGVSHGAIVGTGNGEKPKQKIKCAQGMSSPKYAGVNVKQTKSILKCLENLLNQGSSEQKNYEQIRADVEIILKVTPKRGFNKFRSMLHFYRAKANYPDRCLLVIEDIKEAIKLNNATEFQQNCRGIQAECSMLKGLVGSAIDIYKAMWMVERRGKNVNRTAEIKENLAAAEDYLQWTLFSNSVNNIELVDKAKANMDNIDAQMQAKEYDNAKKLSEDMLKESINAPLAPLLNFNLALINLETNNCTEAFKNAHDGTKAAVKGGIFALFFLSVSAKCHLTTNSFKEAVAEYEKIYKIDGSQEVADDLKEAKKMLKEELKSKTKTSKNKKQTKKVADQNRRPITSTKKDERAKTKATEKPRK